MKNYGTLQSGEDVNFRKKTRPPWKGCRKTRKKCQGGHRFEHHRGRTKIEEKGRSQNLNSPRKISGEGWLEFVINRYGLSGRRATRSESGTSYERRKKNRPRVWLSNTLTITVKRPQGDTETGI